MPRAPGAPGDRPCRSASAARLDRHERCGDHVLRQPLLEEAAQLEASDEWRVTVTCGSDSSLHSRQAAYRREHPREPRPRIGDGGVFPERRLDLAQLDAEAADLHLVVDAAQELDVAVGQVARQVAGPVEPGAGCRVPGRVSRSARDPLPASRRVGMNFSAVSSGRLR